MMKRLVNKKIVCIGGGTGTFVVLKGLKHYTHQLCAIVAMSDSGGSNKRIRDEFGLLPTSDVRQCLVALSDENGGIGLLRKLFMYRFEKGKGLRGMTFGNLFMAALSDILGSQAEAIRQTAKVLRIHGTVLPVSFTETNLYAEYENGHVVNEEHLIDEPIHDGTTPITTVYLKPKAKANPEAVAAILNADLVVLGPGDLFTSIIPNALVSGISQALHRTKAKKAYVVNLMTKYGQTYNFTARRHIDTLSAYIRTTVDYVIVNTGAIPRKALDVYAKGHEYPVVDDVHGTFPYRVVRADVVSRKFTTRSKSDTLVRSLIRHDSGRLAKTLISLA